MLAIGLSPQDVPQEHVVRLTATEDAFLLDSTLVILVDPSHTLTIDDIRAGSSVASFRAQRDRTINFGYSNAVYWVAFSVVNAAPERTWLLEVNNPSISRIELFLPDTTGGWSSVVTGTRFPFTQRPIAHPAFVFPLTLPARHPLTGYLKIRSDEPVRFSARIWAADAFYAQDRTRYLTTGLYYGVLLIMVLHHLALFIAIRDRIDVYFALFIATFGLLQAITEGLAYAYLWPEASIWNQESRGLLNGVTVFWGLLLTRHFLDTPHAAPRIDVVLRSLVALSVLLAVYKLLTFLEQATAWPEVLSYGLAGAIGGGVVLLYVRRGTLPDRFHYHTLPDLAVPLLFLGILLPLSLLSDAYTGAFDRAVNTILSLGSNVLVLLAGAVIWYKGLHLVRFFFLGIGLLLMGTFVSTLMHVGTLPFNVFTASSDKLGMVLGFAMLSFALGVRMRLLEQGKTSAEAEVLLARNAAAEAQFEALQAKINPHFLFNVLNSIASLIRVNPTLAERAVEKLARIFRYTLRHAGSGMVPLTEELAVVRTYLALEKLRLDERLDYTLDVTGDLNRVLVPALLLQPVVENSVKYAVAPRHAGGRIDIDVDVQDQRCRILVRDDGPGWHEEPTSSGHGLPNIRERLRLSFGDAAALHIWEDEGVVVEMLLPVRPVHASHPVASITTA